MTDHSNAEAIASQVREALILQELFDSSEAWVKLYNLCIAGTSLHVKETGEDIGGDMLTEAGFNPDYDMDAFRRLHRVFVAGFCMGNAWSPENDGDTRPHGDDPRVVTCASGKSYTLAAEGIQFVFFDLLDKATEALHELADDPSNENRKGRYDQAVESLRSVLDFEERDAYWVVLQEAIARHGVTKQIEDFTKQNGTGR